MYWISCNFCLKMTRIFFYYFFRHLINLKFAFIILKIYDMNTFEVKYEKKGKPTSLRKFKMYGGNNYEDILFDSVLNIICNSLYKMDYFYSFLGNTIFIKRLSANIFRCNYIVECREFRNSSKVIFNYNVEIECLSEVKPEKLLEECRIQFQDDKPKEKKDKNFTKWVLNERRAIRNFLYFWSIEGDLKKSNCFSKATYYRNLKECIEKGYIKDGKLVRKVIV